MLPSLTVDVFSDVVCPWCFIGSVRLEQALEGLKDELEAEVCYHPFFLDASVPPEGISVPDKLRKKYGVEPKQLWARAESAAHESGLALDLSKQPMMYPTGAAHTLLRHAHARGTQQALVGALFRHYFQDAQNIADPAVLSAIAAQHGFTRAEALELIQAPGELELTHDEATSAVQGGIRGVPFFIFGGRLAVSGAQSVAILQAAMRQALAHAAQSEAPPAAS
jgi:predicted DsbA family dithiol-disulfide isomerase